jgi:pantetheine-phosphate adenylyltransferase
MIRVCLGGTFDPVHDGHLALFKKGFELGDSLVVGITSDKLAKQWKPKAQPFEQRAEKVSEVLKECFNVEKYGKSFEVVKLNDRYGPALYEDFDYIVVSPETYGVAKEINNLRMQVGRKELKIVKVPWVLADDFMPISSFRVKAGEIDIHGKRLKRLPIKTYDEDLLDLFKRFGLKCYSARSNWEIEIRRSVKEIDGWEVERIALIDRYGRKRYASLYHEKGRRIDRELLLSLIARCAIEKERSRKAI